MKGDFKLPLFSVNEFVNEMADLLFRMVIVVWIVIIARLPFQRTVELINNRPSLYEISKKFAIVMSIMFCIAILLVTIPQ